MRRGRTRSAGEQALAISVVWDEAARAAANRGERNYWHAYVWEILDRLGVRGLQINPSSLSSARRLARFGAIIIGGLEPPPSADAAAVLAAWVRGGGILIGFAPEGLGEIFGVEPRAKVAQPADDFAITGYLELARTGLTQGLHARHRPQQRLIIISPICAVAPLRSRDVARFFGPDAARPDDGARAHDSGLAAVTARRLGRGWAFYFGFDLPHTIWALQQGRPIDRDYDRDGYLRSGDAIVIGRNNPEVGYADELVWLLESMLALRPVPMIHQLPAQDGAVPDALFCLGGDDECEPGVQVAASRFMKSRGLPYHINLMPLNGRFAVSRAEFRRIRANGHELSLHYNFMDGFAHPGPFTERDVRQQNTAYRKAFGRGPICTVNHWCRWTGWAEPAKWMLAAAGKADNSRIHWPSPPLNPVNRLGFAFGSSFPFFFRDDWRGGNVRIPFVQEPIVAYELGYEGERTDFKRLRRAIDLAAHQHLTMSMFLHPTYISSSAACRAAIDERLRYIRARRIKAVFMGNDELWRWWWQRSRARITAVHCDDRGLSFSARCDYSCGFVVKIPLGERSVRRCAVDDQRARFRVERRYGRRWVLIPVPRGAHDVALELRGGK